MQRLSRPSRTVCAAREASSAFGIAPSGRAFVTAAAHSAARQVAGKEASCRQRSNERIAGNLQGMSMIMASRTSIKAWLDR
jgi:hypothetical protein